MREKGRETGNKTKTGERKEARKNVNEAGKNGINAAICAVW